MPCCRRRFCRALRRNCATWPQRAETCCNARAAPTSANRARARRAATAATSAPRAQAARHLKASIAPTPFSGTSEQCIATHPSDMCVAMAALEATILVEGPKGKRTIPFADFHKLPGNTPHIENALEPGELITYVDLPKPIEGAKSVYLKLRDRASYEFALASAAVVMQSRRRAHPLRSRSHGRRGNKALALARSRSRVDGQGSRCSAFPHRGGGGAERCKTAHR